MKYTIVFKNGEILYLWGNRTHSITDVLTHYVVMNDIVNIPEFLDTIECYYEEKR